MAEPTDAADEHPVWNRETLLDSVVNLVPLGIIAFFLVLFLVANPWGGLPPLVGLLSLGIMLVTFVFLVYVTWETAKRV